jgi:hypothetical protein
MALRGDTSLPNWLRSLLKILLNRMEGRSNKRKTIDGYGVVALLSLTFLLALDFHNSSTIFNNKGHVNHGLGWGSTFITVWSLNCLLTWS